MSLIGRYHIMLTHDEYASIVGRLKGFADVLDVRDATDRGDRLRAVVRELENNTTYIQEEE